MNQNLETVKQTKRLYAYEELENGNYALHFANDDEDLDDVETIEVSVDTLMHEAFEFCEGC